jgi:hypothetical protein
MCRDFFQRTLDLNFNVYKQINIVQLVIIPRSLPESIFFDAFIFLLCVVNEIHLKWVSSSSKFVRNSITISN